MSDDFDPTLIDRAVTEIRDAIAFVERRAVNRADVVKKMFCALLTREHFLLQARTGVGKSLLANQVFAMFDGARIFQVQASKEQQPDTYFGALDLEELKKGRLVHNTEGSLVESEFGFIDEIFDGVPTINFRSNVFECDPLELLLEIFARPLPQLFTIDLRRNRVPEMGDNFKEAVGRLLLHNLKVIV